VPAQPHVIDRSGATRQRVAPTVRAELGTSLDWAAAKLGVRALAATQRRLDFIQPPERDPEPVQRLGRLLLLEVDWGARRPTLR
jgi:hypothetical protein